MSIGFDYFTSYTVILDPTRVSGTFFRVTTHIQSICEIFIQINHIKNISFGIKDYNFLNSTFEKFKINKEAKQPKGGNR